MKNNKNDFLLPANVLDLISKYEALPKGDSEKMAIEARLMAIQSKLKKVLPDDRYKRTQLQ